MSKRKDEKSITIVPDLAHVFPLPVRVVPEPWEDLASLLSRTAVQMGYEKVQWLLRAEDYPYNRLNLNVCFLRKEADYQFLERLLRLNIETLYKLTFHRFLLQMQAPDEVNPSQLGYLQQPLFLPVGQMPPLFLSKLATRVCPRCLAEEPSYSVLYWNIGPVVACLKHHIFLVDCCPSCQGKIPILRSNPSRCPRCHKGDYRLAATVDLPEESLFLSSQALVLAHLGVEEKYRGVMPTVFRESPLHGLLPWQYFQLFKLFKIVLDPFFPNNPVLQTVAGPPIPSGRRTSARSHLSLGEWTTFALTFHTLFTSWPDNFTALLESLQSVRSSFSVGGRGLINDFGTLYERYLYKRLRDRGFDFLRGAFEDYLKKRYTGGRVTHHLRPFRGMDKMEVATQCTYVTLDQAIKLLGIQQYNLLALISSGTLRAIRKPMGTKGKLSLWFIERADVEALLEEWKDLLSLEAVAQMHLGVSKHRVLALSRAGLLLPARGQSIDKCHTWYYKSAELERLKGALLQYAGKAVPPVSKCIPLSYVTRSIGLSLVECLKEILGGHLRLIDTERNIPLFQRLVLSDGEVHRFLEESLKAERFDLNLLSSREVMEILGVGEDTLKEWVRLGVLIGKHQTVSGMLHGLLFQREMVDSFRRTYVLANEAAELLDVHDKTIYKYVSRGILHPLSLRRPYLFLREEIEALIPPDTLISIPQAATLLGMSDSRLYRLVRAGHIPIMRLVQCPERLWLLSSDVERFRDRAENE